ncbi:hypothetical protein AMTRI_Chr05g57980 [Amborella trichopoda]|uniref:Bet v I/Major latex protein domain-containing protein n=1 Tax=Amborella trichopoda TaxID=13333 RepID=U5CYU0_AMBTC|nr:lachrymatory-factor synthase [Amborella trichopoda]ERN15120.1 hypothetical protein AMTR_s00056p00095990 [Amborella trichopoda]|eukprot:XP_006853653.1 lachrymatory-factor synthase [Amborella trichopoda]
MDKETGASKLQDKEPQLPIWEATLRATVHNQPPHKVWQLLEDFFSIEKWLPTIDICKKIEGINGKPGCIRYCAASSNKVGENDIAWATEKLVFIDSAERKMIYVVTDSNVGLVGYEATVSVLPESHENEEKGSVIDWFFKVEPQTFMSYEGLVEYVKNSLEYMAKKMEEFLYEE